MELHDIELYTIPTIIKSFLSKDNNSVRVVIIDNISKIFSRTRVYDITYPIPVNADDVENAFSNYMMSNIVEDNNILKKVSVVLSICKNTKDDVTKISIIYYGQTTNPDNLIKKVCVDIIEQLNKHLIEYYMDEKYPDLSLEDPEQKEKYNEIINNIEFSEIYNTYKHVDVYVPINIVSNTIHNKTTFYLNGTITTSSQIINILDNIRECLDSDDMSEVFEYNKDDIVFKYGNMKELKQFTIITNAKPFELINI